MKPGFLTERPGADSLTPALLLQGRGETEVATSALIGAVCTTQSGVEAPATQIALVAELGIASRLGSAETCCRVRRPFADVVLRALTQFANRPSDDDPDAVLAARQMLREYYETIEQN